MASSTVNLLLASDLHLDVGRYDLGGQIARHLRNGYAVDAVVLAGDLMEVAAGDPVAYAAAQVPQDIPVAFVPGNHDFYGGRYGNLLNRWRARAHGSRVKVLAEEEMVVSNRHGGEVVLLGTPLWSNLQSMGPVVEAALRQGIQHWISDFSCMFPSTGGSWTVERMLEQFERAYRFLEAGLSDEVSEDGRRRVVVTHFAPHRQSISEQWRSDDLTAYFVNHLPELVERADLWLHGHTHEAFDYQVGSEPHLGRVICHPRGYSQGIERSQALSYVPRLIQVPVERVAWDMEDEVSLVQD